MVKPTYKVEGMPYDDEITALLVAERIWERYDQRRDIIIYQVDHHGEESVYLTLDATREPEGRDPNTEDMFPQD